MVCDTKGARLNRVLDFGQTQHLGIKFGREHSLFYTEFAKQPSPHFLEKRTVNPNSPLSHYALRDYAGEGEFF